MGKRGDDEAYRDDPDFTSPEMEPGHGEDQRPAGGTRPGSRDASVLLEHRANRRRRSDERQNQHDGRRCVVPADRESELHVLPHAVESERRAEASDDDGARG